MDLNSIRHRLILLLTLISPVTKITSHILSFTMMEASTNLVKIKLLTITYELIQFMVITEMAEERGKRSED